jgi:hypothetical protein
MTIPNNTFTPGPSPNTVRAADGKVLSVPEGWILLPPGDAALTRRIKAAGDHWVVAEKKGRKVFSRGVWAPAATIERIRADLEAERSTDSFAKKKEADARRRDKAQAEYVEDFHGAVVKFLAFHGNYADLADRLARAVADHANPVDAFSLMRLDDGDRVFMEVLPSCVFRRNLSKSLRHRVSYKARQVVGVVPVVLNPTRLHLPVEDLTHDSSLLPQPGCCPDKPSAHSGTRKKRPAQELQKQHRHEVRVDSSRELHDGQSER